MLEEQDNGLEEELGRPNNEEAHEEREMTSMELAITMTIGITGKSSLKMKGQTGNQEVVVFIDCGATHNFIASDLVKELVFPTLEVKRYLVTVANMGRAYANQKCPRV